MLNVRPKIEKGKEVVRVLDMSRAQNVDGTYGPERDHT